MNLNNRQEETIRYREPFSTSFRRRQRQFTGVNYDDRSPKVVAMNAHLRASAYGQGRRSSRPTYDLDGAEVATIRTGSFPNLLREYNDQARDNFRREAVLFTIITAIGFVWPVAQTMHILLP
jgi:hypothetical protein